MPTSVSGRAFAGSVPGSDTLNSCMLLLLGSLKGVSTHGLLIMLAACGISQAINRHFLQGKP